MALVENKSPEFLYCGLMEEIKKRIEAVTSILDGSFTTCYRAVNVECMVLQIRKVLELVALGSLVIHEEEYRRQHQKFAKHWHAARIIKDVEEINPDFYPVPFREVPSSTPGVKRDWIDLTDGFMTKGKLIEVYDRCGSILHASNPFAGHADYEKHEKLIPEWATLIRNLLNAHRIHLADGKTVLVFHMKGEQDGSVQAYTFELRRGPPPPGQAVRTR